MNLYHIKLTDNQKAALEHLFSQDVTWNKTELEKAWDELREQVREAAQGVAIINALRGTGCNCKKPTKYDPNRKFRKGDRVRVVENKGRCLKPYELKIGDALTVSGDESDDDTRVIACKLHNRVFYLDPAYLELDAPVEEIEPYYIEESTGEITLLNKHNPIFHKSWRYSAVSAGIIALAEAEAERDRLNAECRKEQE